MVRTHLAHENVRGILSFQGTRHQRIICLEIAALHLQLVQHSAIDGL